MGQLMKIRYFPASDVILTHKVSNKIKRTLFDISPHNEGEQAKYGARIHLVNLTFLIPG